MSTSEQQTVLAIYGLFQNLPIHIKQELKKLIDESLTEDTKQTAINFSWDGFQKASVAGKEVYARSDLYEDSNRG